MIDFPPVAVPAWKRAMMNLFDTQGFTTAMTLYLEPARWARTRTQRFVCPARTH